MGETKTHTLKTWPDFFDAVASGEKTFEIRKNDRGFQKGDKLILEKFDPADPEKHVSENALYIDVTYVLNGFGLENGFVALGLGEKHVI
jgi:ASC-1-like (ASCH) protein